MVHTISEPDWKLYRQLHPIALERFCQRVLSDLERLAKMVARVVTSGTWPSIAWCTNAIVSWAISSMICEDRRLSDNWRTCVRWVC